MNRLYDFIVRSSSVMLDRQNPDGSMKGGHNGPYHDPETPVRTTSHWCLSFLKAHDVTGEAAFLKAALSCGKYLLSDAARPMKSVFYCRMNPNKDFANGLVGQAWAIEALDSLYKITGEEKFLQVAVDVFLMHPYDSYYGAWIRRNVDGSLNGFDRTFNHELWFAAAGGLLSKHNNEIRDQVSDFLDRLNSHLEIYRDGCIRHKGMFLFKKKEEILYGILSNSVRKVREGRYMRMKSVGYHGFNLYAFALLKEVFPAHPFWEESKFRKTLQFASSDRFKNELINSKYAFPYNPPGFEMPYAFQVFQSQPEEEIEKWISWQFRTCYDFESGLMTKGTFDELTAAARLYEATRLKNYRLNAPLS